MHRAFVHRHRVTPAPQSGMHRRLGSLHPVLAHHLTQPQPRRGLVVDQGDVQVRRRDVDPVGARLAPQQIGPGNPGLHLLDRGQLGFAFVQLKLANRQGSHGTQGQPCPGDAKRTAGQHALGPLRQLGLDLRTRHLPTDRQQRQQPHRDRAQDRQTLAKTRGNRWFGHTVGHGLAKPDEKPTSRLDTSARSQTPESRLRPGRTQTTPTGTPQPAQRKLQPAVHVVTRQSLARPGRDQ